MGVSVKDIVSFKAQDDWITHGTEYAQLSWTHTYNRMGSSDIFYKMRNIVKGITAQDGVEEQLLKRNIPYNKKDRKRWYETDRYDLEVNGVKYDVKCNRVSNDFSTPKDLLEYSALVPSDQLNSRSLNDNDIYIFAFINYKEKTYSPHFNPRSTLDKFTKDIEHGKWIVHGFWDKDFIRRNRSNLSRVGRIEIVSEDEQDKGMKFEVGGTVAPKEAHKEIIKLNPLNPHGYSIADYYELFYIRPLSNKLPYGTITVLSDEGANEKIHPLMGFDSKRVNGEVRVTQNDWGDIWLYDAVIYYVGYMTKGEFKENSEELQRFDKSVKQFEIQTDNNRMFVNELRPMIELFQH